MTISTIHDSILEFNTNDAVTMRSALGSGAKYFPYTIVDGNILFCLSKFCQFENATLTSYISILRHGLHGRVKGGGQVKNEIENRLETKWVPYEDSTDVIQRAFQNWITNFYPSYNLDSANFIELVPVSYERKKAMRKQTPDELLKALDHMRTIGEIGETIALEYEYNRLVSLGCKDPSLYVKQESLEDQGAGYDIISNYKNQLRLIEVKSTTGDLRTFYISANEINVLSSSPDQAYIYIVKINEIVTGKGEVVEELHNPLKSFISKEPILFKVKVK